MFVIVTRCLVLMVFLGVAVGSFAQDATGDMPESSCTLAEQIISSNTGEKVGDCPILEGMEVFQMREDIVLSETLPTITSNFIIDGNGHTINGNHEFRIFEVIGGSLTVSNLHMLDGRAGLGSAIFADRGATVYLESSTVNRCVATYSGAIFARYSQLFVNSSEFSHNVADQGAAIYSPASTIQVTRSRFEGNGSRVGGAIYHYRGRGTITSSEFHNNSASEEGGAVVNAHGALQVRDSLFSQNAASAGGAIYSHGYDSLLTVAHSRFMSNESSGIGGAVFANSDDVLISDSAFESNSAGTAGGAIFAKRGALLLGFSSLRNNSARVGSGVYTEGGSVVIIDTAITDVNAKDAETLIRLAESDVRFLDIRET